MEGAVHDAASDVPAAASRTVTRKKLIDKAFASDLLAPGAASSV
jgi:hypothetical protein